MKKNSAIYSAGILSIGALVTRGVGAIYRIPLTSIIGIEGIGMYQMIFPIYAFLIVISTSGIPLAISKMIAEANAKNEQYKKQLIIKKTFTIMSIVSVILVALLVVFANKIASLQGSENLSICYILIAPSILFVGVLCVLRGYFQGEMSYLPTAISQIVEQIVKVIIGLSLSYYLLHFGIIYAVAGAVLAVTISELVACIIIYIQYRRFTKNKFDKANDKTIQSREIFAAVLPILCSAIILPMANLVDSFLIVNLLKLNFNTEQSIALFGIESGIVGTILNLPTVISFALASVIMPKLSQSTNEKKDKILLDDVSLINKIIIIPSVLAIMIFSVPILNLLYGNCLYNSIDNAMQIAAILLASSAISIYFLSFIQIYSSFLQSKNRSKRAIFNLLIGVIIKILLEIILLRVAVLNIFAVAIANVVGFGVAYILSYISIKQSVIPQKKETRLMITSAVIASLFMYCFYKIFNTNWAFLIGILIFCLLYFLFVKKYFWKRLFK